MKKLLLVIALMAIVAIIGFACSKNPTNNSGSVSTLTAAKDTGYGNQTIAAGTTTTKMSSFILTAGSEDVTINMINFSLSNTALASNLGFYVKLLDGSNSGVLSHPISSPTTLNSFGLNLVIAAGTTRTIEFYGDIPSDVTGTIQVTITLVSGTVYEGRVTFSTPLPLQIITIISPPQQKG